MAEHTTPRRNQINKMSPTEVAILSTIRVVENLGADVRLTDAVVLLQAARESVADFLDGVDSRRYVSNPPLPAPVPPVVTEAITDADGAPVLVYMVLDQHNTPVAHSQDKDDADFAAFHLANDEQQLRVVACHLTAALGTTDALRPETRGEVSHDR